MTEPFQIAISIVILSPVAVVATILIDKRFSLYYNILSFISGIILSVVTTQLLIPDIPELGGVVLAVTQGVLIYILYKNTVYATYMTYVVYLSFYLPDLLAGNIFSNLLKIELMKYFSEVQGMLIFGALIIIIGILTIWIFRYATEKIFRFKEIELSKLSKILMYVFTVIALLLHVYLANRSKAFGLEAEALKESLLRNTVAIVVFMFIVYYIVRYSLKKIMKAMEIDKEASSLTEEEIKELRNIIDETDNENIKRVIRTIL